MSETKEAFKRSLKGAFTHAKRVLKTNNQLRQSLVGAGIGAGTTGGATYASMKPIRDSESFKKKPEKYKKKIIRNQRMAALGSAVFGGTLGGSIGSDIGRHKDRMRGLEKFTRKAKAYTFRAEAKAKRRAKEYEDAGRARDKHWSDWDKRWSEQQKKTEDFRSKWKAEDTKQREDWDNFRKKWNSQGRASNSGGGSYREAPPPRRPPSTPTPDWLKNVKTKAEAKKLYREKANTHHPDKGGNTKDMQDLNAAWEAFKKSPDFDKLGMRLPSFFQELLQIRSRP